jgi:methionyl-tRNA formyltransferase
VFKDLESIYDQIRILDGEGYPNANLSIDGFKLDFSRAKLLDNSIIADVKIYKE